MNAITIVKPVRCIKRYLTQVGGTYVRVQNELSAMGFTVHHRAPTNIDKLLTGLPKTVLNELAYRISSN